jgi:cellulose synthase/poly-beta-1,6-N-acetylglucosamine synthase-like glycosyltransferase
MRFSIIMPTRNRADLLQRSLLALSRQTHGDFEVIVIDDGSDPQTRAAYPALWSALDPRFQLVEHGLAGQRGQGPSASRNLGLSRARGDVIAFCDDDDLWCDPDHLARVCELLRAHADIDLCIANQRALYCDGKVRERWLPRLDSTLSARPALSGDFRAVGVDELCASGGFAHLNMLCIRRRVLEAVGGFWEAVNYEEDRDFFWRCVDASAGMAYSPRTVAQHHVPDPARRANASLATTQHERWLVASLVCRHIAVNVRQRSIVRLSLRHEGDLLRHLTLHGLQQGRRESGMRLAWQALAARFSLKWLLQCLWLTPRSWQR